MNQDQLDFLKRLFPNYRDYEVKGNMVKIWYRVEDPRQLVSRVELGGFELSMRFDRTKCLVFSGRH